MKNLDPLTTRIDITDLSLNLVKTLEEIHNEYLRSPDQINYSITKVDDNFVYGIANHKSTDVNFMKPVKRLWFTYPTDHKWKLLGYEHVSLAKLKDFDKATDDWHMDAIYYYDAVTHNDRKTLAEPALNWIMGPMYELMNERNIQTFPELISASRLSEFVSAMVTEKFNKSRAKEAFRDFLIDFDMNKIIENPNYKIMDQSIVDDVIKSVIDSNPEMVAKAKEDPRLANWIVGQVMKACKGQAKAPDVKAKIDKILAE